MVNERTIASTSQMMDPRTGDWTFAMLEEMGIPTDMLGKIRRAGRRARAPETRAAS